MTIDNSNDAEYTSVSVAFSQTVDIPPKTNPAATAAQVSRVHRATSDAAIAAAAAVDTAARRFVAATVDGTGNSRRHARAISTNSGVPGGCGIPNDSTAD